MNKILFHTGWIVRPGVPNPFGILFGTEPEAEPVTLPQDAMILEKRSPDTPSGNQTGYYPVKSYTYEKRFIAPQEWKNLQNTLEFEGVMAQAMVYLNGELLATNLYGYSQFYVPLNSHLHYGEENVLQVIARGFENESRWYPGAGIYRDVWLWQGDLIHLEPEGIHLTTEALYKDYALVSAELTICNSGLDTKRLRVRVKLTAPNGRETFAENKVSIFQMETVRSHLRLCIDKPFLWSLEDPVLYRYTAELYDGEMLLDWAEGCFGIRKLSLDARQGLCINGVETKLRGACIHDDNGILGATSLPDAEEFKLRKLKEAGFNAIRSAHHPAGKALLDVCDRLGMLVMDELSDMWETPKNSADYSLDFVSDWRQSLERMVNKDYNHPCVVMYSLGNEIPEIGRSSGGRRTRDLANYLRKLDSSRYITLAINGFLAAADQIDTLQAELTHCDGNHSTQPAFAGSEALNAAMSKMDQGMMDAFSTSRVLSDAMEEAACELDVVGYNYLTARHEYEHIVHPERVVVGSETYPTEIAHLWQTVLQNHHVIGDFTWAGYDYLGEAGLACYHYKPERHEQGWYPDRLSYCGDIDLSGNRRPVSFLREIAFGLRKEPFLAVERLNRCGQLDNTNNWKYADALDSWTWPGYEGRPTRVHVLSASDEVELFLNGRSLGKHPAGAAVGYDVLYELPFVPGELRAVGTTDGYVDGQALLKTAGVPSILRVMQSCRSLTADGHSLCFLEIDLLDAEGNRSRFEDRTICLSVDGPAILAGFGSADPQAEDSYQKEQWLSFDGRVLAAIRSTTQAGVVNVHISAEGCVPCTIRLDCVDLISHAETAESPILLK